MEGWQDVAAAKRKATLASIPSKWLIPAKLMPNDDVLDVTTFPKSSGLFTTAELNIMAATASEIVAQISKKVWTAEIVTLTLCKAASVAHQLINCVTETMFEEALATAKTLDEEFSRTGKLKGPLHGVPISLKDNFEVKGKAASVGFVGWANDMATSDCSIVALLKDLGAVVYVKTNVPTAMMIAETINNLFGRTLNPKNRKLTPGGSSGGEAALISFRGSPLGVGTDIGGSLRIPAACCGIFTLRPSLGRYPHFDTKSGMAGQEAVISVNGPMARSLADVRLFTKSIIDSEPWLVDPKCLPIPWRAVELPKKLKIAVLWNDGVVMPTPPVRRALSSTVKKLRAAGHEVVDWSADGYAQAADILAKMFLADGGKTIRKSLDTSGESWQPQMKAYADANELGVYEMWQIHRERTALCKKYMDRWNACEGLDAILSKLY
ncbi:Acetamidase [Hyphodiscus hymeniophilus]|uniref:amidase n=1 Tax=Hyphodiscus hymeniophilus TaxID=353542 RepID=A0A9P6VGF9_9HELO|nr:Acetamidase [Hyphodiscus hymeniophilus]